MIYFLDPASKYQNKKRLSKKAIRKVITYWQKYLRLLDWDIWVCYKRESDMPISGASGHITWLIEHKEAVITLKEPSDFGKIYEYNPIKTLIHELVHLHVMLFFNDKEQPAEKVAYMEQVVSLISDALYALDFKLKKKSKKGKK